MKKELIFEELGKNERTLLLRAFDYDVDGEGNVLDKNGKKITSNENPNKLIKAEFATLVPGSLEVIDGTPTALAKYLREKVESDGNDN
ncbi:MAG: hypothetical protein ABH864_05540 [archaeon]